MSKWRLDDGIAEVKREIDYQERTFPQLIARGSLGMDEAKQYGDALRGLLAFLEFCKSHEEALRAFMRDRVSQQ